MGIDAVGGGEGGVTISVESQSLLRGGEEGDALPARLVRILF